MTSFRKMALGLVLLNSSAFPVPAAPSQAIEGTWDLTWQTRKGPSQSGYFVIHREGGKLIAEIHGKGAVRASGAVSGSAFRFHGTKMLVGYEITGIWSGDNMEGKLKVLSVEKRFTGHRRAAP